MTESEIDACAENFKEQLHQWVESQKGQLDAYEYEKSFAEFAQQLARETFARAVSGQTKSRNAQKKS